jgi:hypothetical protein
MSWRYAKISFTSRRSKNLCPPTSLLGICAFCKVVSKTRERALYRTLSKVSFIACIQRDTTYVRLQSRQSSTCYRTGHEDDESRRRCTRLPQSRLAFVSALQAHPHRMRCTSPSLYAFYLGRSISKGGRAFFPVLTLCYDRQRSVQNRTGRSVVLFKMYLRSIDVICDTYTSTT